MYAQFKHKKVTIFNKSPSIVYIESETGRSDKQKIHTS